VESRFPEFDGEPFDILDIQERDGRVFGELAGKEEELGGGEPLPVAAQVLELARIRERGREVAGRANARVPVSARAFLAVELPLDERRDIVVVDVLVVLTCEVGEVDKVLGKRLAAPAQQLLGG
jgi:hypothetical protein